MSEEEDEASLRKVFSLCSKMTSDQVLNLTAPCRSRHTCQSILAVSCEDVDYPFWVAYGDIDSPLRALLIGETAQVEFLRDCCNAYLEVARWREPDEAKEANS